jgi:hypothetical protein
MRRFLGLILVLCTMCVPAFADAGTPASNAPREHCWDRAAAGPEGGEIQLAQSDCRGNCSSSRGYCMSTCRDSFCRAVCNDRYQSCVSSCRR